MKAGGQRLSGSNTAVASKHLGQRFPNFSRQITWEPQNADSDLSLEFKSEFLHSQQAPSDVAAAGLQTTLGGERI